MGSYNDKDREVVQGASVGAGRTKIKDLEPRSVDHDHAV
jgi:hypothetical protein